MSERILMTNSTLKVAIIRLSSLGDIISTLVFLDFIKAKFAKNLAQDSQDSHTKSAQDSQDSHDSHTKSAPKILFLAESSKANKEFSLKSFYALAQNLWGDFENAKIFLIWDKKEAEIRALGETDSRFCVLPKLNLDEIKALLVRMDLVIGGDTGITHTAWAMKIPSITLYISTNMERFALGWANHISLDLSDFALDLPQIIQKIHKSAKDLLK
ncbi:glycosyltransferase family 9 protein [Helicobacter sp. 23-1045]